MNGILCYEYQNFNIVFFNVQLPYSMLSSPSLSSLPVILEESWSLKFFTKEFYDKKNYTFELTVN